MRDADGRFVRITVPGDHYTIPHGINDEGRVVGWYIDSTLGLSRGFIAIPCRVRPDRPDGIPVTRVEQ